jgi:hypothetical protein
MIFYSIRNDAALIERRLNGNKLAAAHMKKAQSVARLLFWAALCAWHAISGLLVRKILPMKTLGGNPGFFYHHCRRTDLWIVRNP